VNGTVLLKDITSDGLVMLNRASVGGRLRCTGSTFTCPAPADRNEHGHAITAISATFRGGMDLGWSAVMPSADFTNATTSFLADDPDNWPPHFTLSGFTYDRFEQPQGSSAGGIWDTAARTVWLNRQPFYDASPYEQVARVYRQHGHTQSSRYPASSMFRSSRRNRLSWIFSARIDIMTSWSSDPKQSEISPSISQAVPVQVLATSRSAVWQPRAGRNPCDRSENWGS
jgi:hypothetical protein